MAEETNTTVTETEQAENSGGDPKGGTGNAVNAVSTPEPAQAEKTFTQKELDDIVKQRLDRAKKDMPSKEELKAFKAWQDSQKTAPQSEQHRVISFAFNNFPQQEQEYILLPMGLSILRIFSFIQSSFPDAETAFSVSVLFIKKPT